jgi:magnesium-protoporphyrin IX monomethyl ester (oxidative) cyclase
VVVKSPQKEKEKEKTHFVRNPEFKADAEKLQGPLRQIFVEFLERSCIVEFLGFLL